MRWTHPFLHRPAPDVMAPVAALIWRTGHADRRVGYRFGAGHLYGVDELGRRVLSKRVSRAKLGAMVANLPACVIGMEACSTSHHWARRFQALGHEIRLIHPNFVRPYVKGNKNDGLDAEAICEAAGRPNMRFVPVKTVEQQDV